MKKTNVNGVELDYEERGSGEAVLLIGPGPIADSFLPLLSEKALVERYRLITYRQRRPNPGTDVPVPVSFAEHAADAVTLLANLGVQRAHVAGHSTGAAIALQMAVDYPAAAHSLALLEPPLLSVPSAAAFLEKAGPALAAYGSGDREGAIMSFLTMACSLDWAACQRVIEKQIPGGVARALQDSENFFGSYLPALSSWQFGAEQAAKITQPILSVLGQQTEPLFVDSDKQLRSWFPRIAGCRIEGAAHLLHIQRPEPVARGLVDFFTRHPIKASTSEGHLAATGSLA
jgi:pimeloyl-ACP methyl ester carboxylesterase